MKRGLVLAGGGARGSYQVGVYQALTELGWRPDVITGTSVGCLNGAMFATGQWATARDMWLTIDTRQVITDPPDPEQGVLNFWQETVRGGGLDVTPLESIVDRVLDEDALRTSPIEFGLVTVNKRNLRPLELTAQQIPQGQMKDYLLASAACFPAFRPRAIEGEQFIDGGYADNMPVGLARRMGAEEVVAVDVDGIGITRRIPPQLPVILVRSHWELGAILTFDPQQARQNIALGYNDTYRAFGRILGIAYSIQAGQERALTEGFVPSPLPNRRHWAGWKSWRPPLPPGRLPLWSGPASWRALRRSRFTPPVSCLRNFYSGWIPRSACVSHRCSRRMRAFVSGRPLRRLPRPESFCRHLWRQACADPREVRSHEKIYRHQCIQGAGHGAGSPAASRHCRPGAGGWSAGARTGSVR